MEKKLAKKNKVEAPAEEVVAEEPAAEESPEGENK